jgi:hypothetical protein
MTIFSISPEMAAKRDSQSQKTPQRVRLRKVSHWHSPACDWSYNSAKHLSARLGQLLIELKQEKCKANDWEFQAICHFSQKIRSHDVVPKRVADHGVKFRSFSSIQSKSKGIDGSRLVEVMWWSRKFESQALVGSISKWAGNWSWGKNAKETTEYVDTKCIFDFLYSIIHW